MPRRYDYECCYNLHSGSEGKENFLVIESIRGRAFDFCLKLIRSQYLKTEKLHMTKETNWHFSFPNRLKNKVAQS